MSGSTATVVLSSAADPAVRRLFNGGAATAAAVNGVFMPGSAMVPPVLTAYAVQVMDARGCFHYLTVTNVQVTGLTTVELTLTATAATPALLTPADINGDICGARVQEEIAISPIHTVLWYLDKETDPRLINVATDGAGAPNKLNLYRQLLDVNDAAVGPPELIAEYAVDLKFGLSIDNAPLAPSQIDLDFESPPASFTTWWPTACR